MELRVCAEIRRGKLPCRSTNVAQLLSDWKLPLVCFLLLYPAEYIWNSYCVSSLIATAWIICDCIMINTTLMFRNNNNAENKWHSISFLITAISLMQNVLFFSYFMFIHTFWYSSHFSVCLQLRRLLWIRTQWGIIRVVWWVADLPFFNISCVNCQNINF